MIKISGVGDKDIGRKAVELAGVETIQEFEREWVRQGNRIKRPYNKKLGTITLINRDNQEIFCIVLGDTIVPFKFGK